jgi:hypothetical protein
MLGQYLCRCRQAYARSKQPRHPHSPIQCNASRLASHLGHTNRVRTPRCLQRTVGIGHCCKATSVEVEPIEITTRVGEGRVSEALAIPGQFRTTVLPILGIARAGNRGASLVRRRFRRGFGPDPIVPVISVKYSFDYGQKERPLKGLGVKVSLVSLVSLF